MSIRCAADVKWGSAWFGFFSLRQRVTRNFFLLRLLRTRGRSKRDISRTRGKLTDDRCMERVLWLGYSRG